MLAAIPLPAAESVCIGVPEEISIMPARFGQPMCPVSTALAAVVVLAFGSSNALACDELASRLIASAVRPAIEGLDCRELARAGLDKAEHRLRSACYESSGPVSTVAMDIELSCRTGDSSFLKASVSERVGATARVRASDCQVLKVEVSASGEIGKILLRAFDLPGRARKVLQDVLTSAC